MKKVIYLIFPIFVISITAFADITGSGTLADPYIGTLTSGDFIISGTKYISSITISGGTLTINPGATIRAIETTTTLTIDGTGILNADGETSTGIITFTSNVASWNRIVFSSSGTSVIDYCIIEKGNTTSFGGGVYCTSSSLTISNSLIRNNYAAAGGGIYILNCSPYIKNCVISNNVSDVSGGGLMIYQVTTPAISVDNCIIEKNTCNGSGGGGGVFIGESEDVFFYNCVIASNYNQSNYGHNIRFYINNSENRPKFYNSIIWGSRIPNINYAGQYIRLNDFNNCALVGGASSYESCINISSTNGAPDGPNFFNVTPGSEDYRIYFKSPCRDKGTNSHSLPNDYYNNDRIGPYDMGIYEVQYSRWKTSASNPTDWMNYNNWELGFYPEYSGTTGDVVIPSFADPANAPNISGTITISSGKYLVLEPGGKATFEILSNSGTLKLESDASNIASLIIDTYNDNGTEEIQLYLTGGYIGDPADQEGRWHYISSPVSSLAVSTFSPGTTLDLAAWYEARPSSTLGQGWVAYDGFIYPSGPSTGPQFSNLLPGHGYNYWDNNNNTFTFAGNLNTPASPPDTVRLAFHTRTNHTLEGYNLIGNPFSAGLNWNTVIADASYPSETSKAIYFTSENTSCAYVDGFAVPSGCGATGIIPPMQGFFVRAHNTGQIITFIPGARTHYNIHSRYKGNETVPYVRLAITEAGSTDETIIRFDELAKPGLDLDFDAEKIFMSLTKTSIYSVMGDTKYAINGQPLPATSQEVPIEVNVITNGNHTISATELQGLEGYYVTLKDNLTGFTADLKSTPDLSFSASAGLIHDRFILKFTNPLTVKVDPFATKSLFNIYPFNNFINIQPLGEEWDGKLGSVKVLDMAGKTVSELQNTEFRRNSITQVQSPGTNGLYFIEIRSGVKKYVGKVVIK